MPLLRTRPTSSSTAAGDDTSNGVLLPTANDGVASIAVALSSTDMSKTGRRYGKSTSLVRGSSRAQTYHRKELVAPAVAVEGAAVVGECPSGQNYYSCATGFKGCCSINACDPGAVCPETVAAVSSSVQAAASSTAIESAVHSMTTDATSSSKQAAATDTAVHSISAAAITPALSSAIVSATVTSSSSTKAASTLMAVPSVPACPSGNNTVYTDNDKLSYTVHCNADNSNPSFNTLSVQIGGYGQCFSACSATSNCAGFTFVGLDAGSCYLKSNMPNASYVATEGSNYISSAKLDTRASAPPPGTHPKRNTGAIAGGIVGGIALLTALFFLLLCLAKRRRKTLAARRATVTHIFGGAVEPKSSSSSHFDGNFGGYGGEQAETTLPLHHNRSASTSHDVFAPYGGAYAFRTPEYHPVSGSVGGGGVKWGHARQRSIYRGPTDEGKGEVQPQGWL